MKKYIMVIGILVLVLAAGAVEYFGAKFMSLSTAEKKWGIQDLNIDQFKSGDLSKRAPIEGPFIFGGIDGLDSKV